MDDYRNVDEAKVKEYKHLLFLAAQKLGQGADSELELAALIEESLSTVYPLNKTY